MEKLGAVDLPTDGPIGDMLAGYDRYGGQGDADGFLQMALKPDGSWDWPGNGGFHGDSVDIAHQTGDLLDRFGDSGGRYLSPSGTSYAERAIPPFNLNPMSPNLGYHRYEVLRPFDAPTGYVSPAFGQPGMGLQVLVDGSRFSEAGANEFVNVKWLLDHGYIREVPVR